MFLYLHPTLPEALTLSVENPGPSTLTRWSLLTTPATPLLCRSVILDKFMRLDDGRYFDFSGGGLSAPLPDGSFALVDVDLGSRHPKPVLEVCQWQDLSTVRTISFPMEVSSFCRPAFSPDGRWLVVDNNSTFLFLFDRLSREVMSSHQMGWDGIAALAFDPTSRFVAGILHCQGGGELFLWRLDPIEHFIPYSSERLIFTQRQMRFGESWPVDQVRGPVVLSRLYSELSNQLSHDEWPPDYPIADILRRAGNLVGEVAFSPDGQMVVFSLPHYPKGSLIAYQVKTGRLLWLTEVSDSLSSFVFAPGREMLIAGNQNGEVLCYGCEDGSLLQRVSTGLDKPIEALAFDHDATSLWLAGQEMLIRYPLFGENKE